MTTLILTPTPLELKRLEPLLGSSVRKAGGRLELCGFGPVAAAARTMQLIGVHRPTRIILVGIAGGLQQDLDVGAARSFRYVRCVGIGAGTAGNHKSAGEIGWRHWDHPDSAARESLAGINDVINLSPGPAPSIAASGTLLTVCAASASESDVALRRAQHPDAVAEDMEGFAVAVACYFGEVPLQIIRGISNRAGDRDTRNWDIGRALRTASELTIETLLS